ncbi:MAG TPA: hypothetical protein PK637_18615 [Flavobacteriales bacterium]|nr:hypothetical protein [Flavobacterium sp.]HRE24427.1 hypothetical protein [Bacteroidia bacterium]HRE98783.1 hypothetical protein [Flavobacteriales bacterium]
MKKTILLAKLMLLFISSSIAQITVKINDKPIKEGQEIQGTSIDKMEVMFSNPKKLKRYDFGRAYLYINLTDQEGSSYAKFYIIKDGGEAMTDFLQGAGKTYLVYSKGNSKSDFKFESSQYGMYKFTDVLEAANSDIKALKFNVKVSLYFRDVVGYQKYGDPVDLLSDASFVINNLNPDGYIRIGKTSFRIKPEDAAKVQYKGAGVAENNLPLLDPISTNPTSDYVYLKLEGVHEFKITNFNFIDTKGKTQNEAIAAFKSDFESFIKISSNYYNKKARKKLPDMPVNVQEQFLKIISKDKYIISSPRFDLEENKNWENEEVMSPFEVGIFKGYKFSSSFRTSDEKTPASQRPFVCFSVVYLLSHPAAPNKLILVYTRENDKSPTQEKIKSIEKLNEDFLSVLSI